MKIEEMEKEISEFNKDTHGSSEYFKDEVFIRKERSGEFVPLSYLDKKYSEKIDIDWLSKLGFVFDSYSFYPITGFQKWYEAQFSRKLTRTYSKKITLAHIPDNKTIFDSVEKINECYELLRSSHILMNGKNLPVQLGEWYGKCIFGLNQVKSTSQRGFDFYLGDKRVEMKVHWADQSSPKGVKLRKSLVDLSEYTIIIYLARNFMIREVCLLDSNFVIRKFAGKGHTIFLKDSDISSYFFSKSDKQTSKVVNSSSLLKFSTPALAVKISDRF